MKKTNKGFSMVELIIVIAIMAILAGALAPALIKYINKSRLATDISTGQSIADAINTALTNEGAYEDAPACYSGLFSGMGSYGSFTKELKETLGDAALSSKVKSKKDMDGSTIAGYSSGYTIEMQDGASTLKVYLGTSSDSDATTGRIVYPTVAKCLTEKTK